MWLDLIIKSSKLAVRCKLRINRVLFCVMKIQLDLLYISLHRTYIYIYMNVLRTNWLTMDHKCILKLVTNDHKCILAGDKWSQVYTRWWQRITSVYCFTLSPFVFIHRIICIIYFLTPCLTLSCGFTISLMSPQYPSFTNIPDVSTIS